MSDVLERPAPAPDDELRYGDEPSQRADVWWPAGAGPCRLVVAIHGGFWRAEHDRRHLGHLCRALRDAGPGLAVVSLEYRRLGEPGGDVETMLDDVCAGIAAARGLARVGDAPPVGLGHSAGGQLALCAAGLGAVPLAGVVALAPVSDLRLAASLGLDRGIVKTLLASTGGDAHEVCTRMSPIERLPLGVRQIVIHGDADRGVPVAMSEGYARRAREAGDDVVLEVVPGVGHLALIDPMEPVFARVVDAVRALRA